MPDDLKIGWSDAARLEIRYTGNLHGDLETLPYLATVIKNERRDHPEMLLVDTGDFCAKGTPPQAMIEVMNHLKFDAAVPGRAEAKDLGALRRMAASATFPLLASNWRGDADVVKPRVVLQRSGVEVALLGLAWPEPPTGFDLVPPEEAIDQALEGLDADRTLVIVLSQLGFAADRNLAVNLDEVQVVLEGVPYPGFTEVTEFGESLVVPASPGGKSLGALGLDLSGVLRIDQEP